MKTKTHDETALLQEFWDATCNVPGNSDSKFEKIGILNQSPSFRLRAQRWWHFFSAEKHKAENLSIDFQLQDALEKRKSTRSFSGATLTRKELITLINPCLTLKNNRMGTPSAGGLYPIDIYIVCRQGTDMNPGIYYWRATAADMVFLRPLPENCDLFSRYAGGAQTQVPFVFFLVARTENITEKYALRSFRLLFLEAGHLSQSLWLLATALKIDFLIRDDFYDHEVSRYLGINPITEKVLTSLMLGGRAQSP